MSSGPNLLIEFESSSNRTFNGFSAKYRFADVQGKLYNNGFVVFFVNNIKLESVGYINIFHVQRDLNIDFLR